MCTKPPQLSTVWLSSLREKSRTSSRFSSSALAHCTDLRTSCVLLAYKRCTEKPDSIYNALDVVISASCPIMTAFSVVLQVYTC